MHPNPIFRGAEADQNLGYARERGFGVLSINGDDGPLMAHIPFLLNDAGDSIDLHLVRSNPVARALDAPAKAVIVVNGPDSYVSPDWYGIDDQVPTWNYVAVHLRGRLKLLPQSDMRDMLDRQSALFEQALLPKVPWKTGKVTPEVLERLMRQIVPARMTVDAVHGTWKLNQNKPDAVRRRAAQSVKSSALGADTALLSALMLAPPQA